MKEFRNELIDNYSFWEFKNILKDWNGYCDSMNFKTVSEKTTKSSLTPYYTVFITNRNDENGVIIYTPDNVRAYIIPDDMEVDMENGTVYSDEEFFISKIITE